MTGQSQDYDSKPTTTVGRRILVTGASGFVGTSLAIEAERRGYAVVRCGRARSADGWVHHDCRDPHSAEGLPLELDAVVHCAGLAHRYPPNTPTDAEYKAINADAAAALARAARGKARRFVLVSSVAAVGSGRRGPIDTGTIAEPETPYGRSKLLAERLVAEALAGSDERDGWCQRRKNRLVILDEAVIQHSSIGTVVAITASSWVFQRQWQDPGDNGHSFREQRAQQTA